MPQSHQTIEESRMTFPTESSSPYQVYEQEAGTKKPLPSYIKYVIYAVIGVVVLSIVGALGYRAYSKKQGPVLSSNQQQEFTEPQPVLSSSEEQKLTELEPVLSSSQQQELTESQPVLSSSKCDRFEFKQIPAMPNVEGGCKSPRPCQVP